MTRLIGNKVKTCFLKHLSISLPVKDNFFIHFYISSRTIFCSAYIQTCANTKVVGRGEVTFFYTLHHSTKWRTMSIFLLCKKKQRTHFFFCSAKKKMSPQSGEVEELFLLIFFCVLFFAMQKKTWFKKKDAKKVVKKVLPVQ